MDSFGDALRAIRSAAGLSLAALAGRAHMSKSHVGHLETGDRTPSTEVAVAVDRALNAGGVLIQLAALERGVGDDMRRRALLAAVGAAASLGALDGPHALAELIRHGLAREAGADEDWQEVVVDAGRRLVSDPSPLFGAALVTNLQMLREQLATSRSPDLFRASACLGQIYGLWLGNQDQLGGAHHWYRTATSLADRSGDTDTMAYTRGRSAARGIYEGWTVKQTLDMSSEALNLTERATAGALEAHAARVTVHALTGDAKEGRSAVNDMARLVSQLPDSGLKTVVAPEERMIFLRAYLECRVGSLDDAQSACDEAESALARLPTWLTEMRVYRGRAMVAAGDVRAGLSYTLQTVQGMRHDVRVISVAVRDVMSVVPHGYRSEDMLALSAHADPNPGPWETLL